MPFVRKIDRRPLQNTCCWLLTARYFNKSVNRKRGIEIPSGHVAIFRCHAYHATRSLLQETGRSETPEGPRAEGRRIPVLLVLLLLVAQQDHDGRRIGHRVPDAAPPTSHARCMLQPFAQESSPLTVVVVEGRTAAAHY